MTEQALIQLLRSMSLEEKAGQVSQIPLSACVDGLGDPTGPMMQFNLTPEQVVLCGSLICDRPSDTAENARVIREMTAAHPHHIPPVLMRDIIHGFRTVFPIPLAMGSTFYEAGAEEMGRISAKEGWHMNIHCTFAPMVDVVRDPRWGRCMESPGESSVLCGAMGAAMVRGFRGEGLQADETLGACVKHYAAYGLCQAGMDYAPSDCSRTEMYNVYLPPFKAALDAGCDMVMPSFIGVDRVPCVCNPWLLKDILRDRWGSDAMVISDYADIYQLTIHEIAEDLKEAAEMALNAGLDMDMMSFAYMKMPEMIREGRVSEDKLDEAVLRVLRLKNKLGLFENPVRNDDAALTQQVMYEPAHRQAALKAAQNSLILLKNDGILPLKSGMKVAVAGDMADSRKILGGWSFDGLTEETETPLEAFKRETRVEICQPEEADVILYFSGEDEFETGEGGSKTRPWLTESQMAELDTLSALAKPVVAVLFMGRAMILTEVADRVSGLLNAWFPGTMGAEAIRSVLMGDVSPSGRASMTFPKSLGQVPIHHDKLTACRRNEPWNKYSNRYVDEQNEPLYPFGFGLSYTDFALEEVKASEAVLTGENTVTVSARVTNTGKMASDTVVQLYARVPHSPIIRSVRNLIGWKRISLAPGESRIVSLPVTAEMLTIFDVEGRAIPPRGKVLLAMGFDSTAEFNLQIESK